MGTGAGAGADIATHTCLATNLQAFAEESTAGHQLGVWKKGCLGKNGQNRPQSHGQPLGQSTSIVRGECGVLAGAGGCCWSVRVSFDSRHVVKEYGPPQETFSSK